MPSRILMFSALFANCSYFVNAIRLQRKAQGISEGSTTANGTERATKNQRSSFVDVASVARKGTELAEFMRFPGLGPPNDLCDALDGDNASFQWHDGPCVKLNWMNKQNIFWDYELQRRLTHAATKKVKHIFLNMNSCAVTEEAAGTIADYLSRVAREQKATGDPIIETIEVLLGKDINDDQSQYPVLGDDGLTKIANALKEFKGTTLRSIELAFQGHDGKMGTAITDAGVAALTEALLGLPDLVYLRLFTMRTKITDISLERFSTVYSNYRDTSPDIHKYMFINFRRCLATTGTARRQLNNAIKEIGGACEFDGDNWQEPILFNEAESYTALQNQKLQLYKVLDEFDSKCAPKFEVNLPYDTVFFSIEPSLPKGLQIHPLTGVISGRPETAQISTTYTIKLVYDGKHVSQFQLTFAVWILFGS